MKRVSARLLGMTAILLSASAAQAAAESELQLSVDGVLWVNSIDGPLFDAAMRWVPGDSESVTFYLRNNGGTSADLTIDVIGSKAGKLLDSGDLHITAEGGGGEWTIVSEPGQHRLLTAPDIADEVVEPITVSASFDKSSTNDTQLTAANLRFIVTLSQSADVAGEGDLLPDTGAPDVVLYAALSAILLGTGLGFVRRRNEAQREAHHV